MSIIYLKHGLDASPVPPPGQHRGLQTNFKGKGYLEMDFRFKGCAGNRIIGLGMITKILADD